MRRQGFRIRLGDTAARRRIRDFSPERRLLKNSRVFRIRYFVGRFTAARRSFVKAKYRSAESYLRSSRVANFVRREGFFYSARAFHESLKLCLLIDSLPIYLRISCEIYYYYLPI